MEVMAGGIETHPSPHTRVTCLVYIPWTLAVVILQTFREQEEEKGL